MGIFTSTVVLHGPLYQCWWFSIALFLHRQRQPCCKYDKHKANQTGKKFMTNTFMTTHSTYWCHHFCRWVSLKSSHFEMTEVLFQDDNNSLTSLLHSVVTAAFKIQNQLKQFICVDHTKQHTWHPQRECYKSINWHHVSTTSFFNSSKR